MSAAHVTVCTDWSGFSSCTQSCGGGRQERRRTCNGQPEVDGRSCNNQICIGKILQLYIYSQGSNS